ncbi:MAG: hypothetical protein ACR2JZ_04600 [Candidatus Limnocylindrales bacterium]
MPRFMTFLATIRGRLRLLSAAILVTLAGALGAPAATLASCLPPNYPAFMAEPNNVIVAGTVLQVAPQQVTVIVQKWWGAGATQQVAIQRPPSDPNVISSVDWNPRPGEAWIILAHRDGPGLTTAVCGQLPGTVEEAQEVQAAVGPGVAPSPPAETTTAQTEPEGLGVLALMFLGLAMLLAGAAALAITRTRRSA